MKILAIGATGATGRVFVQQALAAGHEITAYGRRAGDLPVDDAGLTVVIGDVTDPGALAAALAGHDALVMMLGTPAGPSGWRNNTLIAAATRAVIAACVSTGVRRVIVMSAFGVGRSESKAGRFARTMYRVLLRDVYRDKAEGEAELKQTDLDWTLAYPVMLTNRPASGRYRCTALEDLEKLRGMPRITRADVAAAMLEMTTDHLGSRQTLVLLGTDETT